jgi:hypothetical protein
MTKSVQKPKLTIATRRAKPKGDMFANLRTPAQVETVPMEELVAPLHDPTAEKSIPPQGIPYSGIPHHGTPQETIAPPVDVSAANGYYPAFNDLDDKIIPGHRLDPYEQSLLRRLYRLSRGFQALECEVGLGALAKTCNMSRSQVQKTINSLLSRGLIQSLGHSQNGTRYRVLDQLPAIPPRGIPQYGIPQDSVQGIPQYGTIKYNKDLINTHTQGAVCVGSKFSLEECRRYAEHLRSTGEGITNPGGYATSIHRTGEADALIERFLSPPETTAQPDTSNCPNCHGTGFYYPRGKKQGVAKCPHSGLITESVSR